MKVTTYLIGIPVVVIAAVLAIANRQTVIFSVDPFWTSTPAQSASIQMPLFMLLLLTLVVGALLGWLATALSHRAKLRRRARDK